MLSALRPQHNTHTSIYQLLFVSCNSSSYSSQYVCNDVITRTLFGGLRVQCIRCALLKFLFSKPLLLVCFLMLACVCRVMLSCDVVVRRGVNQTAIGLLYLIPMWATGMQKVPKLTKDDFVKVRTSM